jgi:hypothetical protein
MVDAFYKVEVIHVVIERGRESIFLLDCAC